MWGNIFNLSWKLFKNIYDTKYNHTAFLVNVATDIYSYIGSNYKNFLLFINTLVPPPCLNWKLKVIQYWDFVKNSRNRLVNTRFETLQKIVLWRYLHINQLVSITHDRHISFGRFYEKSFFCDISKVSDEVWHAELLFQLEKDFMLYNISRIMTNVLNNRKYRVILNDQNSPWKKLKLEFL